MAEKFLVLLLLGVVYVNCAMLKGKAFYCRDPETGKLHAVNTTWAASSFCGNYTCNIRRRNITLTSTAPIREFNVTNISNQNTNVSESINVTIEKKIEPNLQTLLHKIITPSPRNMIQTEFAKSLNKVSNITPKKYENEQENGLKEHNCKNHNILSASDENDRYLTEKEIDNIADLLHTVKRSDLDAIVDIYNLAQDIYKEMDEETTDEMKSEALDIIKDEKIDKNHEVKTPSYWYDPLANKGRMGERLDKDLQNTLNLISTEKPKFSLPNYDKEKLLNNNMGITPFYYPVTQFQRISSYTHPSYALKTTTQNADFTRNSENINKNVKNKNIVGNKKSDSLKLIEPSHYLPYPFTNIHPYNFSDSRNSYYGSPWMLDYYNRYKYYQPYYSAYIGPIQKAVLINPHLNNEVQDVEQHVVEDPVKVKKENVDNDKDSVDTLLKGQMTSNWKTDPVPIEVLKDIRADIDTSRLLKAFPLRKKIKLERVGKLINIDDLNSQVSRIKRFAAENVAKENTKTNEQRTMTEHEEYETYLEKVTCRDQVKVGYFRIGNLSQPYPGCCPQLIDTR